MHGTSDRRDFIKKAALFTIVSIILVSSLFFFYISNNKHSERDEMDVIKTRILTVDSFIEDIDYDIQRGLYISSIRSIIGITEYISKNVINNEMWSNECAII